MATPVAAPVWQQGIPAAVAQPGCASCQSNHAMMYAPPPQVVGSPYAASPPMVQEAPTTGVWAAPATPSNQPFAPSLTPVPQGAVFGSPSSAGTSGASSGSPTPADMAPSLLKPSENPIQAPSNVRAGPSNNSGSAVEYPTITPSLRPLADPDAYAPQSPPPATNLAPVGAAPVSGQPTSSPSQVLQGQPFQSQPFQSQPGHGPSREAPLLLNPNDRSA